MELRHDALAALALCDPDAKATAATALFAASEAGAPLDIAAHLHAEGPLPGRPEAPRLVDPRSLSRRSPFTTQGKAALLHAVAHIEFNAINLALDAVWRFPGLPEAYYRDWLRVAAEEAMHFRLVRDHLRTLGFDYGDFDAHEAGTRPALLAERDALTRRSAPLLPHRLRDGRAARRRPSAHCRRRGSPS